MEKKLEESNKRIKILLMIVIFITIITIICGSLLIKNDTLKKEYDPSIIELKPGKLLKVEDEDNVVSFVNLYEPNIIIKGDNIQRSDNVVIELKSKNKNIIKTIEYGFGDNLFNVKKNLKKDYIYKNKIIKTFKYNTKCTNYKEIYFYIRITDIYGNVSIKKKKIYTAFYINEIPNDLSDVIVTKEINVDKDIKNNLYMFGNGKINTFKKLDNVIIKENKDIYVNGIVKKTNYNKEKHNKVSVSPIASLKITKENNKYNTEFSFNRDISISIIEEESIKSIYKENISKLIKAIKEKDINTINYLKGILRENDIIIYIYEDEELKSVRSAKLNELDNDNTLYKKDEDYNIEYESEEDINTGIIVIDDENLFNVENDIIEEEKEKLEVL